MWVFDNLFKSVSTENFYQKKGRARHFIESERFMTKNQMAWKLRLIPGFYERDDQKTHKPTMSKLILFALWTPEEKK